MSASCPMRTRLARIMPKGVPATGVAYTTTLGSLLSVLGPAGWRARLPTHSRSSQGRRQDTVDRVMDHDPISSGQNFVSHVAVPSGRAELR